MKNNIKDKGITLIALIITIVVLIILASVAINLILGENGLFKIAKQASIDHKKAQYYEEIKLEIVDEQMERQLEGKDEAFIVSLDNRLKGKNQASSSGANTTYTRKPWVESTIMCDDKNVIHSDSQTDSVYKNTILIIETTDGYEIYIDVDNGNNNATIREKSFDKKADDLVITYDANGGEGTQITGSVKKGFYLKITDKEYTRNNYTFTGWCKDKDGNGKIYSPNSVTEEKIEEDTVFYAQWSRNAIKIIYNANNGTGKMDDTTAEIGKTTKLSENGFIAPNGYEFDKWTTNVDKTGDSYNDNGSITVNDNQTENITLYAQWKPLNYTIVYNLAGGNISNEKTTYTIEDNDFILVTPTKEAHDFDGWTDTNTGIKQNSITITKGSTGNRNYTANWKVDSYTKLLYHFDDNSNDVLNHTSQNNGNVTYSTDSKFGKSAYFNGSSFVKITTDEACKLGNIFTIDWWEKRQNSGSAFYSGYYGTCDGCLLLTYNGSCLYCSTKMSGWNMFNGNAAFSNTQNSWTHWALVRNGSTWKTYKNGQQYWTGSNSSTIGYSSSAFYNIARYRDGDTNYYKGYIDEFRLSIGIARWTNNFTVPSEPY